MASKGYGAIALTGGGTGALDKIDGSILNDGDVGKVSDSTNNKKYEYTLEGSGASGSSPLTIPPVTNPGTKNWVLIDTVAPTAHINNIQVLTASGDLVIKNQAGSTIATLADGQTLALAAGGAIDEFSIDGTMGGNSDTAVPTEKAIVTYVPTIVSSQLPGLIQRAQFIWSDADQILIEPGLYHHQGTLEQLVYWDSQLDFKLQSGGDNTDSHDWGADGWHYIYLDDSAIDTLGSNLLDDTCFLNVTGANAAPAWTVAKHGWYGDGVGTAETNDRCIFAVYETGNAILTFWHDGGSLVMRDAEVVDRASAALNATWTEVTCTVPAFCRAAQIGFRTGWVDADTATSWRVEGSSGTGHSVGRTTNGSTHMSNITQVMLDSALKFEVRNDAGGANLTIVNGHGWYFPVGM